MTLTKIGASLSGGADLVTITQSSHGFTVGKVLKSSGSDGTYATALANTAANAEVVGIVVQVIDANTFTMALSGRITVDGAVPNVTAGSVLFLSASSAGDLTSTEPTTAAQISKPVAVVTTANSEMLMVNYRGEIISSSTESWDVNGSELILDVDGDTSLHANTDDQIDVQIAGADDFRFTANTLNVLSGSTLSIDSGATLANSGTITGFNSTSYAVTQSSHGFAVGKVLKSSGSAGAYATSQADSAANAEVIGIVTVVADSNNFTLTISGEIDVAAAVPDVAAGTVVFLSASAAGDLTATEPSTTGQISKPVGIVTTQNAKMLLLPYRGEVIGASTAAIADDAVTNAKLANTAAYTIKGNATSSSANPTDISLASATGGYSIHDNDIVLTYDADGSALKTITRANFLSGVGGGDFSNGGNNGALVLGTNDSTSLTLETNNTARMVIASGGQITKPTQPAFSACVGSNKNNVTGGGAWYVIAYDTDSGGNGAWFDTGGNYNTSTYTFTAPVAGVYFFAATVRLLETGTYNANNVLTEFRTTTNGSSSMMNYRFYHGDYIADVNGVMGIHWSALINLPASGTCQAVLYVAGSSNNIDVDGDTGTGMSYFSGYLLH